MIHCNAMDSFLVPIRSNNFEAFSALITKPHIQIHLRKFHESSAKKVHLQHPLSIITLRYKHKVHSFMILQRLERYKYLPALLINCTVSTSTITLRLECFIGVKHGQILECSSHYTCLCWQVVILRNSGTCTYHHLLQNMHLN